MKTYQELVGDALIKVGLGFLGGGFYTALVKEQEYFILILTTIFGCLAIHFGAKLASKKPNRRIASRKRRRRIRSKR